MLRLRALLEREGRWDDELDKQAQKAARKEMLAAIATGEVSLVPLHLALPCAVCLSVGADTGLGICGWQAKMKGPVVNLFTDTFAEMPWHLKEQRAMLETHMREYADDYNLEKYRGATGPIPAETLEAPTSSPAPALGVTAPVDWSSFGPTTQQNMYQAINSAMDIALASDKKALLFGALSRRIHSQSVSSLERNSGRNDSNEQRSVVAIARLPRRGCWVRRRLPLFRRLAGQAREGPCVQRTRCRAGYRWICDRPWCDGLHTHRRDAIRRLHFPGI
jgi:hypothetical protein